MGGDACTQDSPLCCEYALESKEEHCTCEIDRFIRLFRIIGRSVTGTQDSSMRVWESMFYQFLNRQSLSVCKDESATQRIGHILGPMARKVQHTRFRKFVNHVLDRGVRPVEVRSVQIAKV